MSNSYIFTSSSEFGKFFTIEKKTTAKAKDDEPYTLHWKYQLGKWNELSMPLTWDHLGPIQGSFFTYWEKNEPAFFEGWWYTAKKIRQIWAEWAVCVNSYLKKG